MKKYKLTKETINYCGTILYRIEALKNFSNVKKGDKGGFVQSKDNLSDEGDCWIYNDAKVMQKAKINDNAKILGYARIYESAWVCGKAIVQDDAIVQGNAVIGGSARVGRSAKIYGEATIAGNAIIETNTDYIVFKNWWSSGRYFTWTRSNNMWSVGCFYGTGEELIKKACADSEESGREYARIVKYIKEISKFM